jgi:hypothetical protein
VTAFSKEDAIAKKIDLKEYFCEPSREWKAVIEIEVENSVYKFLSKEEDIAKEELE